MSALLGSGVAAAAAAQGQTTAFTYQGELADAGQPANGTYSSVDANGMDYGKPTPLLVEALEALRAEKDAEIEWLRRRMDALERRADAGARKEGATQ